MLLSLGKQDYKKAKAELKETKAKSQAKKGVSTVYKVSKTFSVHTNIMVFFLVYKLSFFVLFEPGNGNFKFIIFC